MARNLAEKVNLAKANHERKPFDFYGTPPEVTHAICDFLKAHCRELHKVREPCCGDGAMSKVLEARGYEVLSSDIRYGAGYGECGYNYLLYPELEGDYYEFDAVITNPPFKGASAIIRRAMRDAPIVCMLLSNDFWHASSRVRLFRTRPPAYILPLTWRPQFLAEERGTNAMMNLFWTVWDDDHSGPTEYHPIERPDAV